MVVGPPSDVNELDNDDSDDYRICPPRVTDLPVHRRYIHKRNKQLKYIFDFERQIPWLSTGGAGREASTESNVESDLACADTPPLDYSDIAAPPWEESLITSAIGQRQFGSDEEQGPQAEKFRLPDCFKPFPPRTGADDNSACFLSMKWFF